jgi:predicted transcriptional regulator/Zn-dependent protease
VRIKLHYSWIPVLIFITAVVTLRFAEDYSLFLRILFGAGVSILYLILLALRELLLGLIAFRRETWIKKMTLFAFGGVYKESADRYFSTHPPLLYFSKYLSSFLLAAIFYGLYATFIDAGIYGLAGAAQFLSYIFSLLLIIHLIPVYPLDAGEILRLILWRKTRDYYRATRIFSLAGWVSGLILIFSGVMLLIITRQWTIDLLIILLGWMIQVAAGYTRRQIKIYTVLKKIRAEDVMSGEFPVITKEISIRQTIREYILKTGYHYVLVSDGGKLSGILTLKQIKIALRKKQSEASVNAYMISYDQIRTAYRRQAADELYEDMYQRNLEYIPVLEENRIIGVVTMSALLNLVKIRSGFGV